MEPFDMALIYFSRDFDLFLDWFLSTTISTVLIRTTRACIRVCNGNGTIPAEPAAPHNRKTRLGDMVIYSIRLLFSVPRRLHTSLWWPCTAELFSQVMKLHKSYAIRIAWESYVIFLCPDPLDQSSKAPLIRRISMHIRPVWVLMTVHRNTLFARIHQ